MSGTGRRRRPPAEEGGGEQYTEPPYEQPQPQYQTYAPAPEQQYDYDWRDPGAQSAPTGPQPSQQPSAPSSQQGRPAQSSYESAQSYGSSAQSPQSAQSAQSTPEQTGFDAFGGGYRSAPATPAQPGPTQPVAPQQPVVPQQPQYDQYDQYESYRQQPPAYGYQAPATGRSAGSAPANAASDVFQPSAPAEISSRPRPRPRPEPRNDFEFEFDLDDPAGGPSSAGAAAAAAFARSQADDGPAAQASAASEGDGARSGDKDGYRPDDFAFVDKADEPDVGGWLTFSETRADTRAERARKLKVRLIALGVLVALVAAGVGVYAWLGGSVPGLSTADQATKSMILFRLDDSNGDTVGDALMVTNRGGSSSGSAAGTGAIVVIPAQMQIDDQGFGAQPFGGDMASDQPPAGTDEVSSALGVTPDGMWTMNETTFSTFVDEVGGISVTANTAVPATTADPKGVTAGPGTLTGAQSIAYATYQAKGEAASVQAARFGQVIEGLMGKMPTLAISVKAYLNALGLIPDPALPLDKLSPILAALAAQQAGGRVTVATLPLSTDGTDTLNATSAAQIVTKLLGGTVKAGASAGQAARVLVQNGTGVATDAAGNLTAAAQAKLVNDGFTYNAGSTVGTQAHTVVEVATSADQGLAQQVAAALGLSGSAVQVVSGLSSVDDVTVVLGQDWSSLSTQ